MSRLHSSDQGRDVADGGIPGGDGPEDLGPHPHLRGMLSAHEETELQVRMIVSVYTRILPKLTN